MSAKVHASRDTEDALSASSPSFLTSSTCWAEVVSGPVTSKASRTFLFSDQNEYYSKGENVSSSRQTVDSSCTEPIMKHDVVIPESSPLFRASLFPSSSIPPSKQPCPLPHAKICEFSTLAHVDTFNCPQWALPLGEDPAGMDLWLSTGDGCDRDSEIPQGLYVPANAILPTHVRTSAFANSPIVGEIYTKGFFYFEVTFFSSSLRFEDIGIGFSPLSSYTYPDGLRIHFNGSTCSIINFSSVHESTTFSDLRSQSLSEVNDISLAESDVVMEGSKRITLGAALFVESDSSSAKISFTRNGSYVGSACRNAPHDHFSSTDPLIPYIQIEKSHPFRESESDIDFGVVWKVVSPDVLDEVVRVVQSEDAKNDLVRYEQEFRSFRCNLVSLFSSILKDQGGNSTFLFNDRGFVERLDASWQQHFCQNEDYASPKLSLWRPHFEDSQKETLRSFWWGQIFASALVAAPLHAIICLWRYRPVSTRADGYFADYSLTEFGLYFFRLDSRYCPENRSEFLLHKNIETMKSYSVEEESRPNLLYEAICLFDRYDFLLWLIDFEDKIYWLPSALLEGSDILSVCISYESIKCLEVCLLYPTIGYGKRVEDIFFHIKLAILSGNSHIVHLLATNMIWKSYFKNHFKAGSQENRYELYEVLLNASHDGCWGILDEFFANCGDFVNINYLFGETSDFSGIPVLMNAVENDLVQTIEVLCRHGADVDVKVGEKSCGMVNGSSLLEYAQSSEAFEIMWKARKSWKKVVFYTTIGVSWAYNGIKCILSSTIGSKGFRSLATLAANSFGIPISPNSIPKFKMSDVKFRPCPWWGYSPSTMLEEEHEEDPVLSTFLPGRYAAETCSWESMQSFFGECDLSSDLSVLHAINCLRNPSIFWTDSDLDWNYFVQMNDENSFNTIGMFAYDTSGLGLDQFEEVFQRKIPKSKRSSKRKKSSSDKKKNKEHDDQEDISEGGSQGIESDSGEGEYYENEDGEEEEEYDDTAEEEEEEEEEQEEDEDDEDDDDDDDDDSGFNVLSFF